ncbi:hypothetical protein RRG08_007931 [Elysia crispata]|uniref:Uncharacterized protein n=1 Tax=Elysia crispata TaxID=231223 RepID=A0AAE0ZRU1_9GAST|nr:hypothetical protein RRG08_007931 [Elysia crispata]
MVLKIHSTQVYTPFSAMHIVAVRVNNEDSLTKEKAERLFQTQGKPQRRAEPPKKPPLKARHPSRITPIIHTGLRFDGGRRQLRPILS